jgi:hypothetical protein
MKSAPQLHGRVPPALAEKQAAPSEASQLTEPLPAEGRCPPEQVKHAEQMAMGIAMSQAKLGDAEGALQTIHAVADTALHDPMLHEVAIELFKSAPSPAAVNASENGLEEEPLGTARKLVDCMQDPLLKADDLRSLASALESRDPGAAKVALREASQILARSDPFVKKEAETKTTPEQVKHAEQMAMDIAMSQAKLGDAEGALETIHAVADTAQHDPMLHEVATELIKSAPSPAAVNGSENGPEEEPLSTARKLVDCMQDPLLKADALRSLASALQSRDPAAAKVALREASQILARSDPFVKKEAGSNTTPEGLNGSPPTTSEASK